MSKNRKTNPDEGLIQEFDIKILKSIFSKPKSLLRITDKGLTFDLKEGRKTFLYNSIKSCDVNRSESLFYPTKYLSITLNNDTSPIIKFYPVDEIQGEFDPLEECLMLIGTFLE